MFIPVSLQTLDGQDLESRNEPFQLPLWTITEIFEKIVIRVDPKVNSVIISRGIIILFKNGLPTPHFTSTIHRSPLYFKVYKHHEY